MEFDMVLLYVEDMHRSLEFYVNVLGFEIEDGRTIFEASREVFVVVRGYGVRLGLHTADEVVSSGFRLVFRVESVDEFASFLESRGVSSYERSEVLPGLYELVVRDPDGHLISFLGR